MVEFQPTLYVKQYKWEKLADKLLLFILSKFIAFGEPKASYMFRSQMGQMGEINELIIITKLNHLSTLVANISMPKKYELISPAK